MDTNTLMSIGSVVIAVLTLVATIYRWRMEDGSEAIKALEQRVKEEMGQAKRDFVTAQESLSEHLDALSAKVSTLDGILQRWQGANLVERVAIAESLTQEQRVALASLTSDCKHVLTLITEVRNALRSS